MCVDRVHVFLFFFKQKTAYEMRISDWSSDVCSSDLIDGGTITADGDIALTAGGAIAIAQATMQGDGLLSLAGTDGISVDTLVSQGRTSLASSDGAITIANLASQGAINAAGDSIAIGGSGVVHFATLTHDGQIGRASGRERVWQYVKIAGVAASSK